MSNLPLYLSAHSFGAWCGAWVAPGQKYMKNGFSGATSLASAIIPIARSVRSVGEVVARPRGPYGWSTNWLSWTRSGYHWLVSPPRKP